MLKLKHNLNSDIINEIYDVIFKRAKHEYVDKCIVLPLFYQQFNFLYTDYNSFSADQIDFLHKRGVNPFISPLAETDLENYQKALLYFIYYPKSYPYT